MLSIRKYVESVAGEETEPNVFDERDRAVSLLDSEEDVSSARRRVNEDSDDDASSWSRCVTENPDAEAISEMEEVVRRRRGNDDGANETFVVDVYFHVIHILGGRGDLRTSVIEEQMKVLNDTFVRGYSDSYPNDCAGNAVPAAVDDDVDDEHHGRTRISFRLVEVTRTRNLLWFYQSFEYEEDIKNALHKGTCADLNVYSVGFCGGLGKSSWPTTCARDPTKDGVMIHFQTVPGGGYEDYEQGDTLVHEGERAAHAPRSIVDLDERSTREAAQTYEIRDSPPIVVPAVAHAVPRRLGRFFFAFFFETEQWDTGSVCPTPLAGGVILTNRPPDLDETMFKTRRAKRAHTTVAKRDGTPVRTTMAWIRYTTLWTTRTTAACTSSRPSRERP